MNHHLHDERELKAPDRQSPDRQSPDRQSLGRQSPDRQEADDDASRHHAFGKGTRAAGDIAQWMVESDAVLDSLKQHLIHGGIGSQTQMHARLEDLQGLLMEMRTLGQGLDGEARAEAVRQLDRMRTRFGAMTRLLEVMRGWADQRLQAAEQHASYCPYGGQDGEGAYRGRASRRGAMEGAMG
ncbi:MAG: hypothetical protein MUF01_15090 [Bryobacterales bacterium]|nr:hypothetical protein [Bryobacterales bacterium]